MNVALTTLGFLVSVAFWPGLLDAATLPRWAVLAVGVPLIFLCSRKSIAPALNGWGAVAVILAIATLAWAPDVMNGVDDSVHIAILAGIFCLGASVKDLKPAWTGLVCGVSVSGVLGLIQVLGVSAGIESIHSASGLFINKNILAEAGLVAVIASLYLRQYWLMPGALLAAVLPMSWAVDGALVFTFSVYLLMRNRTVLASILLELLGIVTICAAVLHPVKFIARLDIWGEALAGMRLFGNGIGSFASNFPQWEFTHSEPLQLAYEFGLLGIPLALIVFYAIGGSDELSKLVLLAIVAVGFFSFPWHMPATGFAAALAAGHLAMSRARVRSVRASGRSDLVPA